MRKAFASLLLLLSSRHAANAAAGGIADDPHLESVKDIFAWVAKASDGYVTNKQSVRRMVENDTDTPLIVFATEDIKKGELLVQTPWSHIIYSDDQEGDDEKDWWCGTARKLADEMQKGKDSFYAPYTSYISDEPDGQLPSQYSKKGKDLLLQIVGSHPDEINRSQMFSRNEAYPQRLNPVKLMNTLDSWYYDCGGKRSDTIGAKAASMVVQRADDHILIPAYDAFNHRNNDNHNGKEYMNARTVTTDGRYHQTFALRDIEQGEQIFISYNMCEQCGGRSDYGFGTGDMFREYGFVEWFPQRWYYPGFGDYDNEKNDLEMNQFDLYKNEDTEDLTVVWTHLTEDQGKLDRFKVFLGREIRRLKRLKNIEWAGMYEWTDEQWKKSGISSYEWFNVNQFADANIVAMTLALEDLNRSPIDQPLTVSQEGLNDLLVGGSHYDSLEEPEKDDLAYYKYTCDNSEFFEFLGFIDTEDAFFTDRDQLYGVFESFLFNEKAEDINICYDVNNSVQMCSNFRPYHHEYMTHIAARYIESVKRVAFVGSGDSMLLHEIMKYPDLELVVGFELDQMVTRKSFKHFKTDPYFHDPRVDWWFGDAAKSVLVLPDSYWGSFDLVLVDLGEDTLNENVVEDLNLFEALSKLVNPNIGVIVKNELYLDKVSQVFDHSLELFYQTPSICSETVAFGSNGVDFIRAPIYDHGIADMGNLLYTTSQGGADDRHRMIHDYRNKVCTSDESESAINEEEEQTTANGVLELVTIENLTILPDSFESITTLMRASIEGIGGFTIVENEVSSDEEEEIALIVMEEGYVAARRQENESATEDAEPEFYLGFDIHLWSQTNRIQELKNAFHKAYKSKDISSHKIVVGGMFGTKNWKEDAKHIGPMVATAPKKTCNAVDDSSATGSAFDAEAAGKIVIQEVVSLTNSQKAIVAVFCGSESDSCASLDVLKDHERVEEVIPIFDCASSAGDDTKGLYECEKKIAKDLASKVSYRKKLHMLVLDSNASQKMHQIANSIFDTHENRNAFLMLHSIAVTWSNKDVDSSNEPWRREFLDRYRKQIHHDPVKMGEFDIVSGGKKSYRFGVVSTNDSDVTTKFAALETKLQDRLPGETRVSLRNVHGGLYNYVENIELKDFVENDYDKTLGKEHFEKQVPLAIQTILQYEGNEQMKEQASQGTGMDCNFVEKLVYGSAMNEGLIDDPTKQTLFRYSVGEGCVVMMLGNAFSVITVWDGRVHLDVNFFADTTTGEETASATNFDTKLREFAPFLKLAVDAQPRGLGNIVNFQEDLVTIDPMEVIARRHMEIEREGVEEEDEEEEEEVE